MFRFLVLLYVVSAPVVCAAEFTLKLGHVQSSNEPIHDSFLYFADAVKESSKGRVTVDVYAASALGTNKEVYELARLGASVIANVDSGYLSDYVPEIGILAGPYLLDDIADYKTLLNSEWFKEQMAKLYTKGLKVIALNGYFGARHIISDKQIRSPDDLANLQIRIPPNTIWVETFKALGASPTTLAWSEVYSGLAQGVVHGAEAPLGSLIGARLYEGKKVISSTGHFRPFVGLMVGRKYWESLPEEVQDLLMSEGQKWGLKLTELTIASEGEQREFLMSKGVEFVDDIDYRAFRTATQSVYANFPDWGPNLHSTIQSILTQ